MPLLPFIKLPLSDHLLPLAKARWARNAQFLPQNFAREKILEAIPFDKKFEGGKIRFVVTPKIGSARLSDEVTLEDIREAIAEL